MRSDKDYQEARDGEELWDHANRILSTALLHSVMRYVGEDFGKGKGANHYFATYQQSFAKTRAALSELIRSRATLHRLIKWEPTGPGEYRAQLITESDTEIMQAVSSTSANFVAYVISWQPLMDSIAGFVSTVLAPLCPKLPDDMRRLSRSAASGELPCFAAHLREALTERVEWYKTDVRVLRNQFVHNDRVAHLFPEAGSEHTIVSIKKLEYDETEDRFRLDAFISWTFGKLLLFAISLDKGLYEVQMSA